MLANPATRTPIINYAKFLYGDQKFNELLNPSSMSPDRSMAVQGFKTLFGMPRNDAQILRNKFGNAGYNSLMY
jgi:hypothetical protein